MLSDVGMDAFAERARRELLATGERARKRTVETLDELTPQEQQVAPARRRRTRRLQLADETLSEKRAPASLSRGRVASSSPRRGARMQHEHTEHVAAPPDVVYAAIS